MLPAQGKKASGVLMRRRGHAASPLQFSAPLLISLAIAFQLKAERGHGMPTSSAIALSGAYHPAGKRPVVRAYRIMWKDTSSRAMMASAVSVLMM